MLNTHVEVGSNETLIKKGEWSDKLSNTIWDNVKKDKHGMKIKDEVTGLTIPKHVPCNMHVSLKVRAIARQIKTA